MENFWVKLAGTVQLIWDLSSYELHLADLKDKKKEENSGWWSKTAENWSRFCLPIVKRYATKLKRYRITLHDQLKITLTSKCTSRSKTNGKNEIPHFLNREHPHSMVPQSSYCNKLTEISKESVYLHDCFTILSPQTSQLLSNWRIYSVWWCCGERTWNKQINN